MSRHSRKKFRKLKKDEKVAANSGAPPHSWYPRRPLRDTRELSWQHWESDLVAGRYSPHGMSDCRGVLSALFRSLKRVGAFALKLFIATSLFSAGTASLGENVVLLAVPWPHIIDSVWLLEVSPTEGRGCRAVS